MLGLKKFKKTLGCKEERYKNLLKTQTEKAKLFEEAYITQKERYNNLNGITIDLIRMLIRDDVMGDGLQKEVIELLQKGLDEKDK